MTMELPSYAEQRIETRTRFTAVAAAKEAFDKHFDPNRTEDIRDIRELIALIAEQAAYDAIKREQQNHREDMEMLMSMAQLRFDVTMLGLPRPLVADGVEKTPNPNPLPETNG